MLLQRIRDFFGQLSAVYAACECVWKGDAGWRIVTKTQPMLQCSARGPAYCIHTQRTWQCEFQHLVATRTLVYCFINSVHGANGAALWTLLELMSKDLKVCAHLCGILVDAATANNWEAVYRAPTTSHSLTTDCR